MHTSTRLAATDFYYGQRTAAGTVSCSFADFCPNYHELDRVAVVSLSLEDGVLYTGRTLLALTTAFYDSQRERRADFFDYPQHFALVGTTATGVQLGSTATPNTPELWAAWSWLDVWPSHKWISAPPTATGMLQRVFDYQINRLFWPYHLLPTFAEQPLPDYAYRMLRTRLKAVYYYSLATGPQMQLPTLAVRSSAVANELWQECIARLPAAPGSSPAEECFQAVQVDEFLRTMQLCQS